MYRHKQIAFRLANGHVRDPGSLSLPPEVKEGLRQIARMEGKSMNWVVEQVIIAHFKLPKPEYVVPKWVREQEAAERKTRARESAARHARREVRH